MPESHWFHQIMERGGKIVSIVPEYGPQSSKSDYWIPVRAGLSDTAIFLYLAKELIGAGTSTTSTSSSGSPTSRSSSVSTP
jgi:nitrate reductase / nitrite oxidoreductase, alpha subunit